MSLRFYDAHNHLQDERISPWVDSAIRATRQAGVAKMVVNGSSEEDWPHVLDLANRYPEVLPSFGYHPWYVRERTPDWEAVLRSFLDRVPSAIGEIGLDKWVKNHDLPQQEEVFVRQLRLAAERNLPVSIHCLQAWGKLVEALEQEPRPQRGFLLHSYGGSIELIERLAKLGAYFSLPGYFAHDRKQKQRETFRHVPRERLLIETDAPDQLLPEALNRHPLKDPEGKPLNQPANLVAVYEFAAELLEQPIDALSAQVEENFLRLFGSGAR